MSLLYICFIYECLKPLLKNYMLYICHYKTCTNNMIQTFKRTKYLSKKFRAFYMYSLLLTNLKSSRVGVTTALYSVYLSGRP